jgi:hypothetical protein
MVVEPVMPRSQNRDDLEAARLSKDWTPAGREALRAQVLRDLPRWYSPLMHFLFPATVGIATMVVCLLALKDVRAIEWLTIPATFLLSNALEWRAHKSFLHKRMPGLTILFDQHTPKHHRLYTEEQFAITDWRELSMVLLPSFGILAILSLQLPLLGLGLIFGLRNVALLFLTTSMAYTLAYEWLHLAYHLPPDSFIGRRALIRWLRTHHQRHHNPRLMQRWNMNVTIPLWDWIKGTIYRPPVIEVAADAASAQRPVEARVESR